MGCIIAILLLIGPRITLLFIAIFTNYFRAFESFVISLAGFIFLPWTTLGYMYTFHTNDGAITGGYVILMIACVGLDISSLFSGGREGARRRRRIRD